MADSKLILKTREWNVMFFSKINAKPKRQLDLPYCVVILDKLVKLDVGRLDCSDDSTNTETTQRFSTDVYFSIYLYFNRQLDNSSQATPASARHARSGERLVNSYGNPNQKHCTLHNAMVIGWAFFRVQLSTVPALFRQTWLGRQK